jgi:hypothetical protein
LRGDSIFLPFARLRELGLPLLDLLLEAADLREDLRVLVGDPARRLDPVEDVVQARGAEDDLDQLRAPVHVQVDEPRLERPLGLAQVGAGDLQPLVVDLLLGLDLVELDLLGVERLDDVAEIRVELLDLRQDLLCLSLFRLDLRGSGDRRLRQRQDREREQQDKGESFGRSDT